MRWRGSLYRCKVLPALVADRPRAVLMALQIRRAIFLSDRIERQMIFL